MILEKLDSIFAFIADHHAFHANDTRWYEFSAQLFKAAIAEAKQSFEDGRAVRLGELGPIVMPYRSMGAVDTLDLFGLDELIIFAYYLKNQKTYQRTMDVGANLGLHSIVMAKLGFQVAAYEPDPTHFAILQRNIALNDLADRVQLHNAALSDKAGEMEFVRVLGNTTGSHLAGSKANPYGDLERFPVRVEDIKIAAPSEGLIKIDAEGHEVSLLRAIGVDRWKSLDAFVEVGTAQNAADIFNHFAPSSVNLFAQKSGWGKIVSLSQMPTSHREGSIFITSKSAMTW